MARGSCFKGHVAGVDYLWQLKFSLQIICKQKQIFFIIHPDVKLCCREVCFLCGGAEVGRVGTVWSRLNAPLIAEQLRLEADVEVKFVVWWRYGVFLLWVCVHEENMWAFRGRASLCGQWQKMKATWPTMLFVCLFVSEGIQFLWFIYPHSSPPGPQKCFPACTGREAVRVVAALDLKHWFPSKACFHPDIFTFIGFSFEFMLKSHED